MFKPYDEKLQATVRKSLESDIKLRWIVLGAAVPSIFFYIMANKSANPLLLFGVVVATVIMNLCYIQFFQKAKVVSRYYFYVTGFFDTLVVTAGVVVTGGLSSPLFLIYFVILLDASFDHWEKYLFHYLAGLILIQYTTMFFIAGNKFGTEAFYLFSVRIVFLLVIGVFGYYISGQMKKHNEEVIKINEEKDRYYKELKSANVKLEEKVKKSTENLEKTNLMLVKKNISLLAAHEIYKTANEAKNRSELLEMVLGIIFPLMKGNGGIIFSLGENNSILRVDSLKKIIGMEGVAPGAGFELTDDSELRDVLIKKRARLFEDVTGVKDVFVSERIKSGSCIAAPLIGRGKADGIVLIFNKSPYVYNKTDAELIELLGEQIGTLLYNRELYDEMSSKAAGLEKLMKITVNIESSIDVDEIISTALVESIKKIFLYSSGVVVMAGRGSQLRVRTQYGCKPDLIDSVIPVDSIVGWVCKNNKPLFIKDAKKLKFYNSEVDSLYLKKSGIVVPISTKGKIIGAMLLTRQHGDYTRDELYLLSILANYVGGSIETAELYSNVQKDYINTIYALAAAVDAKDHYTHGHSTTVMKYATKIAEELKMGEDDIETVKYGALLHDIGKIGISENIINKPGKLTSEEYGIIKMHPQLGANIISKIDSLKKLVPMVLSHHEWLNGTGYPLGLRGEEIPFGARIISVADAYSTMTSKRPYRDERSNDYAIKELRKFSGTQFDGKIVQVMVKILKQEEKEEKEKLEGKETAPAKARKEKKRLRVKIDGADKLPEITNKDEDLYS